MTTLDPLTLFGLPGCDCGCECCGAEEVDLIDYTVDGVRYLTDRFVIVTDSLFRNGPDVVAQKTIDDPAAIAKFRVQMFKESTSDSPSAEWFQARYLDPIEAAGLRVRPTADKKMHVILDSAGLQVGALMPVVGALLDTDVSVRQAS